jgi:hypothetical protein
MCFSRQPRRKGQNKSYRATESTQEWTNPKRAEEQKITGHSKHHFREQEESIASKCQNEAI